ncbi:MAG: acyl-CoA dehydrogenase family protein [Nitrospinota bacterium]
MTVVELEEELKLLRESVRAFVARELQPIEQMVDERDEISPETYERLRAKAAAMGLLGLAYPSEYGGSALGVLAQCVVREEFGKTSDALRIVCTQGPNKMILAGTEEQKERYLAPAIRGERLMAFAVTEPDAGSDVASIRTRAQPKGDGFVLNGRKHFVTNGPIADVVVVFAVTDPERRARGGITAFLVDRGTPGFSVGRIHKKMGWRGSPTSELIFENCRVPRPQVLGELGGGFSLLMKFLDEQRLAVGAGCVGTAERLLRMAREYARERVTFGRPLADRQAIQFMLADSAVEIHAGRLMVYEGARRADEGERVTREAAMAKVFCSEMAGRVADRTLQIFGGMGYMKELPIERMNRDLRNHRIAEGTSEILRIVIARDLLGP